MATNKQKLSLKPLPWGWGKTRTTLLRMGAEVLGVILALSEDELRKKLKEPLGEKGCKVAYGEIMATFRRQNVEKLFDTSGTNPWPLSTRVQKTFGNVGKIPVSALQFFGVIDQAQRTKLTNAKISTYSDFTRFTEAELNQILGTTSKGLLKHLNDIGISLWK